MKEIKLTKHLTINDNGELYKDGKLVKHNKRHFVRVGKEVQQLAYWIGKYFVPGYFDGAVIDHIDSNPLNNNPNNLQWITQSDNILKRIDFENSDSQKVRKYFSENGKNIITHTEIVKELMWKKRHNGKFRFENDTDSNDFAVK